MGFRLPAEVTINLKEKVDMIFKIEIEKKEKQIELLLSTLDKEKDQYKRLKRRYDALKIEDAELKLKLEVSEQKCKLLQLEIDRLNNNTNIVNPIITDAILPANSTVTNEYGARCFISNLYPGYVWRNCIWYKIVPNMYFDVDNHSIVNDLMYYRKHNDEIIFVFTKHIERYYSTRIKKITYF